MFTVIYNHKTETFYVKPLDKEITREEFEVWKKLINILDSYNAYNVITKTNELDIQ